MGPPPWTLKTEKTWLINYIKGNFEKKGGLAGLKEDALGEFLMAFPKEKRASETEDEMVKRYELLPRRISKWIDMRYKDLLNIGTKNRDAQRIKAPLYDPVQEQREKRKKTKTRQKSAYDVARSDRKDLYPVYKEEAMKLFPNDDNKQQGHINKSYTNFVNENKAYWVERARQVNATAGDENVEEEDTRLPRKKLTDSLNYTLGLYASSWAEDANAVIYTIAGLLDEKNELRIYVNTNEKDGKVAEDLKKLMSSANAVKVFKEYLKTSFPAAPSEVNSTSEVNATKNNAVDLTLSDQEEEGPAQGDADKDEVGSASEHEDEPVEDKDENEEDKDENEEDKDENEEDKDENEEDKDEEDHDEDTSSTKNTRATTVDAEGPEAQQTPRMRGRPRKRQSTSSGGSDNVEGDEERDEGGRVASVDDEEEEDEEAREVAKEIRVAKKRGRPKKSELGTQTANNSDMSRKGGKSKGVKRKDREGDEQSEISNPRKKSKRNLRNKESSPEKENQDQGIGARTRARRNKKT